MPEIDCVMAIRSSWMGAESAPYARSAAAFVKVGTPVIPAYSLSSLEEMTFSSAVRTDGNTYGFPLSSPVHN